jgi:hypothetical protein
MTNGPPHGDAIALNQKLHDWVAPFLRALREGETGQHGRDQIEKSKAPSSAKATVQAMG